MAGRTAKLTALAIKHTKPGKLFDGGGLYIETTMTKTSVSRRWYLKYTRPDGRENRLPLGPWPEVSIPEAREHADNSRALLRRGIDPAAEKLEKRVAAKREAGA